jgi:hypothetical protein
MNAHFLQTPVCFPRASHAVQCDEGGRMLKRNELLSFSGPKEETSVQHAASV